MSEPFDIKSDPLTKPGVIRYLNKGYFRDVRYHGKPVWAYTGASDDFLQVCYIKLLALGVRISYENFMREFGKLFKSVYDYKGTSTKPVRSLFTPQAANAMDDNPQILENLLTLLLHLRKPEFNPLEKELDDIEKSDKSGEEKTKLLIKEVTKKHAGLLARCSKISTRVPSLLSFALDIVAQSSVPVRYNPNSSHRNPLKRDASAMEHETPTFGVPADSGAKTSSKKSLVGASSLEVERRFELQLSATGKLCSDMSSKLEVFQAQMAGMEQTMAEMKAENGKLKEVVDTQAGKITELEKQVEAGGVTKPGSTAAPDEIRLDDGDNSIQGLRFEMQEMNHETNENIKEVADRLKKVKEWAEGRVKVFSYQLSSDDGIIIKLIAVTDVDASEQPERKSLEVYMVDDADGGKGKKFGKKGGEKGGKGGGMVASDDGEGGKGDGFAASSDVNGGKGDGNGGQGGGKGASLPGLFQQ